MNLRSLAAGLLILASSASLAQRSTTGVLVGRVRDGATNTPVAGAEVVIANTDRRATTDSAGEYRLADMAGGSHELVVRRIGYKQATLAVTVIIGVEAEYDVRLARAELDTVTTTAPGNTYRSPQLKQFEERRLRGRGAQFVSEEQMRKGEERTLGNILRRVPGLRIVVSSGEEYGSTTRSAGGEQSGTLLGGANRRPPLGPLADPNRRDSPRGCWVSVYMDGNPLYLGDSTVAAPDLSKIAVRDLAGAEFYAGTGTLPAQFSMTRASLCGVLLLWTRER